MQLSVAAARRWLLIILLLSVCINSVGLRWGLPNGNATWAADALRPLVPMALVKRAFYDERWNSGWITKYPLGYPLVLISAQLPYFAWLHLRGELRSLTASYPYGFRHPEDALTRLALLSRAVSVLMGVGVVALAYGIGSALFGVPAGLVAALLAAGCYPLVFYAHTTNVDVPVLFWSALAIWAALMSADRNSTRAAGLAGVAAAVALFAKEQSMGVLVVVPLVWLIRRASAPSPKRCDLWRCAAGAAIGFVLTTVVVGNVWWNPSGFVNRWRFLAGVLPAEIRSKYLPYQSMIQVPKFTSLASEFERVGKVARTVAQGLTTPVATLAMAGVAWAGWRRLREASMLLLLCIAYYLISSRSLVLIQVRYTIPLVFFGVIFAGAAGGALLMRTQQLSDAWVCRASGVAVAGLLAVLALLPGIEVDHLLVRDPRYAAEAWLRSHVTDGARIETYQPLTYLPRFEPGVQHVAVPLKDRTVAGFQERQPEFVILSSGGRAGLIGHYEHDWQPGKPIMVEAASANEFFDQLRSGALGYAPVVRFQTPTYWVTPRINSVNPEITIFGRAQALR